MSENLGELLESLRGKMSLREAAERSGLSHTYIRDIEIGFNRSTKAPVKPSPETLQRLGNAYNYPYEDLMRIAGYITASKDDLASMNRSLNDKRERSQSSSRDKKDLKKLLEESELMFDGVPLTNEDKAKVEGVLEGLFWEAKQMNKRKKKTEGNNEG